MLVTPSKTGPRHGSDLRHVVDAMLYISHTECRSRFRPEEFGPRTRVWSQFRRSSRNGTWTRVLASLHESSRVALGLKKPQPLMVVIDTHLVRWRRLARCFENTVTSATGWLHVASITEVLRALCSAPRSCGVALDGNSREAAEPFSPGGQHLRRRPRWRRVASLAPFSNSEVVS